MAYTARKLITKAYYLAGIVSRDLQEVSGSQATDGLEMLNALLGFNVVEKQNIPYYREYDFNAVAGQEEYFIPNLIEAETLVFYIGSVRYSMMPVNRDKYFGAGRADNIQTLPFNWHLERTTGGSNIYMYFFPNTDYPLKLWGKFGLDIVASLDEDLSLVYDPFYIEYLRYSLAEYICADYNITFQPQAAARLAEYQKSLYDLSPKDLTNKKVSTLQKESGLNWGDINIGKGWRP